MSINSRRFILALGAIASFGAGCLRAEDLPLVAWHGKTMGSGYVVEIVGEKLTEAQVSPLKAKIARTLEEVNRKMSNYLPESELSRFNRAPAYAPFRISPDFAGVVRFGLSLSQASDGAFDPTLGPLINLWGFGEKTNEHTVPADEVLRATQAKPVGTISS